MQKWVGEHKFETLCKNGWGVQNKKPVHKWGVGVQNRKLEQKWGRGGQNRKPVPKWVRVGGVQRKAEQNWAGGYKIGKFC